MANSIGGEARNQFRSRDRCIEPAMMSTYWTWLTQLRGGGNRNEFDLKRENRAEKDVKAEGGSYKRGT